MPDTTITTDLPESFGSVLQAKPDRLQLATAKAVHDLLFRGYGRSELGDKLAEEIASAERADRPATTGKYRDRLLSAALRMASSSRARPAEPAQFIDLDFLEVVDAIFEEIDRQTPWQAVISWFENRYGYNPDPSTTPDGDVLRWAMRMRLNA